MPLPKGHIYTAEDYWNLPEGERAELIDGKLYAMAPPMRMHQKISSDLCYSIRRYIESKKGSCEVYAAPFAVNLHADDTTYNRWFYRIVICVLLHIMEHDFEKESADDIEKAM